MEANMRILYIGNDDLTISSVSAMLEQKGMVVDIARANECIESARQNKYTLILLDFGDDHMAGLKTVRRLRQEKVHTPIITLSINQEREVLVTTLNLGADAHLTHPLSEDLLIAHIHAVVQRSYGGTSPWIKVGTFSLNMLTQQFAVGDVTIKLTEKECEIIQSLMLSVIPLSADEILTSVYKSNPPAVKTIVVCISKIRSKIAKATGKIYIETIWGKGYMLRESP
jgi:two-component system cell cycle response regulator CtrA